MIDDKYIEMVRLQAQIDVLVELPYMSVYRTDSKLNELRMRSAVMMEDLIRILNEKRGRLAALDGTKQTNKLKGEIKKLEDAIEKLGVKEEIEKIIKENEQSRLHK